MALDLLQERQQAHVSRSASSSQRTAVRSLLESMIDLVAQAIAHAPVDDDRSPQKIARPLPK